MPNIIELNKVSETVNTVVCPSIKVRNPANTDIAPNIVTINVMI